MARDQSHTIEAGVKNHEYEFVPLYEIGKSTEFIPGVIETVLYIQSPAEKLPDAVEVNGVRYEPAKPTA